MHLLKRQERKTIGKRKKCGKHGDLKQLRGARFYVLFWYFCHSGESNLYFKLNKHTFVYFLKQGIEPPVCLSFFVPLRLPPYCAHEFPQDLVAEQILIQEVWIVGGDFAFPTR